MCNFFRITHVFNQNSRIMDRRSFIKKSAAAAAGISIIPAHVLGGALHTAPSDTVYMAGIGVGGRGLGVLKGLRNTGQVKFVALADVSDKQGAKAYELEPGAKRYRDFRRIYDKHLGELDAIFCATPDHTHAVTSLPFMRAGKHAFVEKPLTHTIVEARMMAKVAKEQGLVTQMGDVGASSDGIRTAQEIIESGMIGAVNKVDCWTNRPVWPQGLQPPTEAEAVPDYLDWDLWLGPAAARDYNSRYLPFKWRGFWDFGTGALGDMGCHIMETPYRAMGLGYPTSAEASCTTMWAGDFIEADYQGVCPPSAVVRLTFEHTAYGTVKLNWYDGGLMPERPALLPKDDMPGNWDGGSVFYGSKGILVTDTYSRNPRIYMEDGSQPSLPNKTLIRVAGDTEGHIANFVDGILGKVETSSPFSSSGPLTEAVLMGNLAIKAYQEKHLKPGKKTTDWAPYEYPGRTRLNWDGANMKITNYEAANRWVGKDYREGWNT